MNEASLLAEDLSYQSAGDSFDVLKKDIEEDYYMIVTVGEFNNGKSTFLNALVGEDFLPTGVTPTTATINSITWGEKREFQVHKVNGVIEQQTRKTEDLNQFIVSSDFNAEEVEFLKIYHPSPLLKDKIVLVDTPGLNDINKLRSNVTYQFIPRADVVFFVVNISAPIRKTEYKFLAETLLKQGLDRIIFIANFIDRIEEDEIDEVLIEIENRIKSSTGLQQVDVFPLSAYEALTGRLDGDDELVGISGITAIEEKMKQVCQSGSRSDEKSARYKVRLTHCLNDLLEFIKEKQAILQKAENELNEDLNRILEWKGNQKEREQILQTYIDNRKTEIMLIVRKSIDHLFQQINEEVEEKIQLYNGTEINDYLKSHIPMFIKRRLKQWIEDYSDKIHILLGKLEMELSTGLTKSFQEEVKINGYRGYDISSQHEQDVSFEDRKMVDPIVTSGLLVGGISSLAMILGGPILIPVIGMAGLPFIQKKLLKKQLELLKPEIIAEARKQLFYVKQSFAESIERYIENSIEKITRATLDEFNHKSSRIEQTIEFELKNKHENIHEQNEQQKQLSSAERKIEELFNRLAK